MLHPFAAAQLEGRRYEVLSSEPGRVVFKVDPPPPSDAIRRLAEDDCYFRGEPRTALTYDPSTDAVMAWECDPAAREIGELGLTLEQAVERIRESVEVPVDHAVFRGASFSRKLTDLLVLAEWTRRLDGLDVAGDDVRAEINRTTGRLVRFSRGPWQPLPAFPASVPLAEARRAADKWIAAHAPTASPPRAPDRSIRWIGGRYLRVWVFWYDLIRPITPEERREREVMDSLARPEPVEATVPPPYEPTPPPRLRHEPVVVCVDDRGRVVED